MSYFPDLSPYTYFQNRFHSRQLNIGWLDTEHDFPKGPVSKEFIDRLWYFCAFPAQQTRGVHGCEFCRLKNYTVRYGAESHLLSSAEIRAVATDGTIFAAPNLIFHYVRDHHYLPPAGFIDAVLHGPQPHTVAYQSPLLELDAIDPMNLFRPPTHVKPSWLSLLHIIAPAPIPPAIPHLRIMKPQPSASVTPGVVDLTSDSAAPMPPNMTGLDILFDRVFNANALKDAVNSIQAITAGSRKFPPLLRIRVIQNIDPYPRSGDVDCICRLSSARGQFSLCAAIDYRMTSTPMPPPVILASNIASFLACNCLISDDTPDPYRLVHITPEGRMKQIVLDTTALNERNEYNLTPAAPPE